MYGKMKKAKYLGICLALFCMTGLSTNAAFAQEDAIGSGSGSLGETGSRAGTAGASELLVPLTARTTALANATASGIAGMGGLEALYSNPAGLALNTGTSATFSRLEYVADIGVNYFGLAQAIGTNSSIAFTVASWDFGNIPKQTELTPEISDVTFNVSYLTAGVAYARQLTDRIAAGATLKIISEELDDVQASTIAFDAGMTYVVGESGLRIGVALKNVGNELQFSGNGLIRSTQLPGQEPSSNNNAFSLEGDGVQLPTLLNFGAAYSREVGEGSIVTVLGNFRSNSFENDQYSFGLEYGFQDTFFLRGGFEASENLDQTFYQGQSFGAGLNLGLGGTTKLQIDYSIVPTDLFDNVQYFTATVTL